MENRTIDILLIEDDLAEAGIIREMLSEAGTEEFSIQHVRYLADGLDLLRSRDFDIALVDLGLPDSQGLATALAVREQARLMPIVILTVLADEETALKALKMDIQDYLVKGEFVGTLLQRSMRYAIQRKHDAEALQITEARFRTLYESNPVMIFILDAEGTVVSTNPASTVHLGYSSDELEGQPVLKIFHEDDRVAVTEQLKSCLQNPDRVFRWQLRKIHKEGGLLWVEEVAHAVYDLNGALEVLVACQDITERKLAHEKIERLNTDLTARAAKLEEANRELEAFSYTVAHDLRKPLTVVNGYCRMATELCAERLDEKCRGYLQEAYDGTWRMNRLIDALLLFSSSGRTELRLEKIDLSAMAEEVAAELAKAEPERKVDFRIAAGLMVEGDASLLRVVMANLLGNAWKFTEEREEAAIDFGMTTTGDGTTYFVRDNGIGFDPAEACDLFIPFRRLASSRQIGGLGIGLATVARIIDRHGGRVWAEGEPGKGATFRFTLGNT
jgi:PAS domain S-box-containing protein